MACYINIEDRYRSAAIRERQMQFVWAATAAAVISVGATAAGTAMSYSASQKAGRAQAAAGKKATRREREALNEQQQAAAQYEAEMGKIQAPEYNLAAMIGDAGQISDYYRQQLEQFQPGAAALRARSVGQINKAMDVTDQYLRGEIPQDVKEQTMRNIAEFGGAGFNAATAGRVGGFQAAQGLVPRQFGLTSLDIQRQGLAAIPNIQATAQSWQQLSKTFTSEPLDVGGLQLRYGQAAADLAMQQATARYNARSGLAGEQKQMSAREYERGIQQAETDLAIGQARAAMFQNTGTALGSGISSAGNAYSQYAQVRGGSTTPMESGFYQGQIGAANAFGVSPSQLSYQKPTGGFFGIGGNQGGYYYTPGGQFGREDIPRSIVYG